MTNNGCFPHTGCCSCTRRGAGSQVDGGVGRRRDLHLPQGGGGGRGAGLRLGLGLGLGLRLGLNLGLAGVLARRLGAGGRAWLPLLAGGGLRGVVLIVQLEAKEGEAEREMWCQLIGGAGWCDRPKAAI